MNSVESVVLTERRGPILVVTLDRPSKRNAVDASMTAGIDAAFDEFDDDPLLRVAVLTARGSVFCAGSDLADGPGRPTSRGGEYGFIRRRLAKPVIAAVDGPALGGGFEIVMACHLVVASTEAWFLLPEAGRGRIPNAGGLFRTFERLPRHVVLEMLLAGGRLAASRAHDLGLVNRLCTPGASLDGALDLAFDICASAPGAVEQVLRAVRDLDDVCEQMGWRVTASAVADLDPSERDEGSEAFRERRRPAWAVDRFEVKPDESV